MGATLNSKIAQIIGQMAEPLNAAVKRGSDWVMDDVEISMLQGKHARWYKTGGKHVTGAGEHQASAPGEAPAIQTGNLLQSLKSEVTQSLDSFGGVAIGTFYSPLKLAVWMEFGTNRIAPRPYATIASERIWPDFVGECIDAVVKAIR